MAGARSNREYLQSLCGKQGFRRHTVRVHSLDKRGLPMAGPDREPEQPIARRSRPIHEGSDCADATVDADIAALHRDPSKQGSAPAAKAAASLLPLAPALVRYAHRYSLISPPHFSKSSNALANWSKNGEIAREVVWYSKPFSI